MKSAMAVNVSIMASLLIPIAGASAEDTPKEYGLPGWKDQGLGKILEIAIIKQDMSMGFQEAVRYVSTDEEIARVAGAFADFERLPPPKHSYDEEGNLVIEEEFVKTIQTLYHIVIKRKRAASLLYLTLDRGVTPVNNESSTEQGDDSDKEEQPSGVSDSNVGKGKPYATVTLYRMDARTYFLPYCRKTYVPFAKGRTPPPLAVLNALYADNPK